MANDSYSSCYRQICFAAVIVFLQDCEIWVMPQFRACFPAETRTQIWKNNLDQNRMAVSKFWVEHMDMISLDPAQMELSWAPRTFIYILQTQEWWETNMISCSWEVHKSAKRGRGQIQTVTRTQKLQSRYKRNFLDRIISQSWILFSFLRHFPNIYCVGFWLMCSQFQHVTLMPLTLNLKSRSWICTPSWQKLASATALGFSRYLMTPTDRGRSKYAASSS